MNKAEKENRDQIEDNATQSKDKPPESALEDKIVTYFGYFEEYSLKSTAKKVVKLIISEYYRELCYGTFEMLSYEEVEEWVLEEIKDHFEEKVLPLIEETCPDLDDEQLDAMIERLEEKYQQEHRIQLESTTKEALKELKIRVKALLKELATIKRKYTI